VLAGGPVTTAAALLPERPYRVLVVDDDPGILRMFKAALSSYGYVKEEAGNVQEATGRIQEGEFDAIVTDIKCPGAGVSSFCAACANAISTRQSS
jgi:CheY-like chemotaxis protein